MSRNITIAAVWVSAALVCAAQQGYYREVYYGISGNAVANLTESPKFPDYPDVEQVVNSIFETPTNIADHYGQRLRAWLTPQVTTNYVFYIATDDGGQLFVSTDDTPENKVLAAFVNGWAPARDWYREPSNQRSAPRFLTAGTRYYVEVLHKEGGGGDNCAVGWHYAGDSAVAVIAANFIEPYLPAPEIKTQPQSVTVYEQFAGSQIVTFTVEALRAGGVSYQWQADGEDIADATQSSYSLVADTAGSGRVFRCVLTSPGGSVVTDEVGYTIVPDDVPPVLEEVRNFHDLYRLTLVFSEPLAATAADPLRYAVAGNTVTDLRLIPEFNAAVVSLASAMQPGTATLLSFSVDDTAQPPNTLTVSNYAYTPPLFAAAPAARVLGGDEPAGPSSRRTQLAITEIQHTPEARGDGRDLRFVELYNSDPFFIDISGYRFSGAFDYVMPQGTVMPANGYLVVAPAPADIAAVYGLSGVLGGFTAAAFDGTSAITLVDELGATLLTTVYLNVSGLQFLAGSLTVGADGACTLGWLSRADTAYLVEWSASLDAAEWQTVNPDAPVAGTGGEVAYTFDPARIGAPARAFFRLRQIR